MRKKFFLLSFQTLITLKQTPQNRHSSKKKVNLVSSMTITCSICVCPAVLYLHWPLFVSQLMSSEVTPGLEQLHISHPTRGWQPNVWGSQVTQSGCSVRGGQMHSPVTGSHSRIPQLHAREKTKTTSSIVPSISPSSHHVALILTFAVGEAVISRGTLGTVSANHVGFAHALSTEGLAGVALRTHLVTTAGHSTIIKERRQRNGRATAERRGCGRAEKGEGC